MSPTQSQNRATLNYNKRHYDRIEFQVKKGQKEKIKKIAEQKGKSLAQYISDLIAPDLASFSSESYESETSTTSTNDSAKSPELP